MCDITCSPSLLQPFATPFTFTALRYKHYSNLKAFHLPNVRTPQQIPSFLLHSTVWAIKNFRLQSDKQSVHQIYGWHITFKQK